ncbi:Non-specific lipid transfer protein GPI-anchored 2 [Carex littledalei]|uniref:Non-specific lipid transfer protein GPI-anchored 2 n=1 Tax=Carex littledalei TaxID=544730 RepID=A0A833QU96_9POAL|nr:Non-specific lipid transfer protein GPI-anchored 2 [Carex littledalei]
MAQSLLLSIGVTMIAMAMLSSHVSAQTSGCMITIVSLSPCLNYITGNSSIPSSSCCSSLSSVIKNEPQCFCMLNDGGASLLGVALNNTKFMELPPSCMVQTPPSCKTESTTTGESSDAMSNKSHVISIVFLVVSALASMIQVFIAWIGGCML